MLRQFRLDGAVAAVTGGGNGIGRATVLALADAGARVAVVDRDVAAAEAVAGEVEAGGGSAWAAAADVSREDDVEALFAGVLERADRLDILVNNAGLALRRPAVELALTDWDAVVAVNMTGAFLCARAAARHMIASGRGGAIVNTSSIMGLSGGGLYPNISYQTTKGAVVNMTRALAVEWATHGIRSMQSRRPTSARTSSPRCSPSRSWSRRSRQ
jgi:NAD(P)-dependent dehydrogenase (short-subunit alcohol dehydrogenase family)